MSGDIGMVAVVGPGALGRAGNPRYGVFDSWAVRPTGAAHAWVRVAGYDPRTGTADTPLIVPCRRTRACRRGDTTMGA
jgi:hypothetical protein